MTYRTGRTVPNTLYDGDVFIGSAITGHKARQIVDAANAGRTAEAILRKLVVDPGSADQHYFDIENGIVDCHVDLTGEALDALAELLKPGPSQGETARLEDALSVERRRVDDMLAKLHRDPA